MKNFRLQSSPRRLTASKRISLVDQEDVAIHAIPTFLSENEVFTVTLPAMEVHRCRFVPYPVSAINALAFSHTTSTPIPPKTSPPTLRLALGRANGDIEIWNPLKGAWLQETILRGGKDRSIEGLAWTHNFVDEDSHTEGKLRLFSIGFSTVITEWDLSTGRPIRHCGANHGEIWCLAAQPRWCASDNLPKGGSNDRRNQCLAVGCADGTILLYSTTDDDLKYIRTLARSSEKKSRVLCLAFRNRNQLIAGYANSTIRVLDINTGHLISTMSLNLGKAKGQPSEVLVWSVKPLPDGDLVSADSTGEVKIWDGKTLSLKQRIKSHNADVLDLQTSVDGLKMMSGGMDRRTILYQRGKNKRWGQISHRRFHTHDVKTMAAYEAGDLNVVVSGGE